MKAKEHRARARRALKGNWLRAAALVLLALAVPGVLALIFGFAAMGPLMVSVFRGLDRAVYGAEVTTRELMQVPPSFFAVLTLGSLALLAAGSLLTVGLSCAGQDVLRGKSPRPKRLFPVKLLGKAIAMNFLRLLLVAGQTLLLIAPGIIALFRYAMADYLLAAHPEMGPIEALRRSRQRMKGRKLELFYLELSFLGLALLCALPILAARLLAAKPSLIALILALVLSLIGIAAQLLVSAYRLVAATSFFRRAEKPAKKQRQADSSKTRKTHARAPASSPQKKKSPRKAKGA